MLVLLAAWACVRPPPRVTADDGGRAEVDATAFQAIAPCPVEADYATNTNTVAFGFLGTPAGFIYDPKCLAIEAGETVTFSGSFAAHPLYPSTRRGALTGNPIRGTSTGDRTDVPFPDPGFFAYYCGVHGGADDGSTMAGVIWVR